MPTLPPLTPLPGARLLAAVRAVDDDDDGDDAEDLDLELESIMGQGEQEQLLVLLRGRGTTPAPRAQQPQIRWDRIVTAGLGVMGAYMEAGRSSYDDGGPRAVTERITTQVDFTNTHQ